MPLISQGKTNIKYLAIALAAAALAGAVMYLCVNNTNSALNNDQSAEPQDYLACGCGCCGGEMKPITKCLYHSKGDDIKRIIAEDDKTSRSSLCATVACGIGIKYVYCD